jgi:tRNA-2-methylthio-N6-dimethylallyladenosine synthase
MSSRSKKYFIKTFGCQANKAESERWAALMEQRGLVATDDWRQADHVFLNTCSVRKAADDRVYALLARMQTEWGERQMSDRPELVVAGCMTRYREKLQQRFPVISRILTAEEEVDFGVRAKRQSRTQAMVQISVGCNSFCTYCVVPYARGRERSRGLAEIMAEVRQAVADGYEEITLLGQNVNSWGLEKTLIGERKNSLTELPSNQSQYHSYHMEPPFVKLLREISEIEQVKKIRFLTSNPWDFYRELVEEVGRNKKIDRYLHLPVQSGSNTVLQRMNRGYTREDFLRLITDLRAIDPEIQIGTDIIVGFGNETEEEFEETVDLVRQANFIVAFVAMYSVRSGTVAEKMYPDKLTFAVKKRRWEILDEIINKEQMYARPQIV